MRRVEVSAGYKPFRDRLGRGVCAAMAQQIGKHVGVRSFGTLAMGRRERLVGLGAADAADEHAVWAVRENEHAGRIIGRKCCLSAVRAKLLNQRGIRYAHTSIDLPCIETNIEQDALAVLWTKRVAVGAKFSEH